MTTTNHSFSIHIEADTKEALSNLKKFRAEFEKFLLKEGYTPKEITAIKKLMQDIDEGKAKLYDLNQDMVDLFRKWDAGIATATNKDLLGLKEHAEITAEIKATQKAYEQLKKSGTLTQTELAQAAMKTNERIKELKAQTNGWVESLEKTKASLAIAGGSFAGLSLATGKAVEFESAMADVAKVVDGTEEQMAGLTARIKELTREIPMAAGELAQIAAAGGQLGVPVEKLEDFVRLAAQMSTAFGMTAEEAGQAVAKLSNIFGLPIEQVEKLGDAINTLGNTTAATESSIVEVLTRMGGTAKQFGLTAEQASALASTMLSMGVSSQVAGTGINALLSKLQTANVQGKEFQNALAGMGISAQQLAADIAANPQKALTEFLHTLEKLDGQERAETLAKLFGIEYQDDIARLLGGLKQYEESLARVGNSANTAGAMQREFQTRTQTTEAQLKLLKNAIEEIAINLGSTFLPLVRGVATQMGSAAQAIAQFAEKFPMLSAGVTAAVSMYAAFTGVKTAILALRVAGVKMFADLGKAVSEVSAHATSCATSFSKMHVSLGDARKSATGMMAALGRVPWGAYTMAATAAAMATREVAEAIASLQVDGEIAESAAVAQRAANQRILQLQTEMHHWSQYKDTVRKTIADLANMDEFARDQYREQLEGAMRYYQAAARELAAQTQSADEEIKKAASQKLTEVQAQINSLKQGLREVQTIAEAGAEMLAGAGKAKAQNLAAEFSQLKAQGKDAAEALSEQFDGLLADADKLGIAALGQYFQQLADQGAASAEKIRTAFETSLGKLSAASLAALPAQIAAAGEEALGGLQAQAEMLQAVLGESFKRLDIDGAQAMGTVSDETKNAIINIETLKNTLDASGASAQQTGRALEMALGKALANARTLEDVQAIEGALGEIAKTGKLSADAVARISGAAQDASARIAQAIPGLQSVGEAMAQAGIKSRAELEKLANDARERFEVIKKSGEATASGLRKAFEDWANAQAAAGGDMGAVEAQAAMLGLQVTVSETGQVTVQAMTQAADAVDKVGDAAHAASDAMGNMADAAKAAGEAAAAADSGTRSGGLITWQKIAQGVGIATADIQTYNAELQKAWDATRHLVTSKNIYFNAQGVSQKISAEMRRAINDARALDDIIRSMESGHASLKDIERAAGVVKSRVGEVGNERLDRLRAALQEVQDKMRALSDSARDALSNVRDELDQLRGNTEAVEKRRGEAQLAALKAQLKEAQEANNREAIADLTRAIKLQEQLNREKLKQIKDSKADEAKRAREEAQRAKEQAAEKDRLNAENAAKEAARNEEEHQRELARIAEQDAAKRREERQITQNTLLIEALNKIGHAQGASATANPITINFNADGILDLSKGNVDQLARALVPRLNNLNRLGYTG
ncbi:MAG: phage tail tape measure protein [Rhodocyclaceae bacterium]|nr:phage tail tape measure protein [Rhodocyclaceae bacterium]